MFINFCRVVNYILLILIYLEKMKRIISMVLFFTLTQCSTPIEFYKYNLEKMRYFNIKNLKKTKENKIMIMNIIINS